MLKIDCKYFLGDRPCIYHKKEGVKCDNCDYYSKIEYNILIIKLASIGDVLRTTSILPSLKAKYINSFIYFLTKKESEAVFINNQYVDKVLSMETAPLYLSVLKFDILLNLDLSEEACLLATIAKADKKFGYGIDDKKKIFCFNKEAEEYLLMSLFDDIKKQNNRTYQELIHNIAQLPISNDSKIIINLDTEEKSVAKEFAKKNKIEEDELIIGLNTGAGKRWRYKKWEIDGFIELIRLIQKELKTTKILLYGSENEKDRNDKIKKLFPDFVINTGYNNTLREFFALLNLSDIVITGDTLGLHSALALGKKVIALFGPTAAQEIEMYNQGIKIVAPLDCICCYKERCERKPNCMESITPEEVFRELCSCIKSMQT